ncbi:hypothetical protein CL631_01330 [bacterium]|nr:hypothetical protein [bacterium]
MTLELIVFFVLLIDSIGANLVSWCGGDKWYSKHFRLFSRYFPATKGWTTAYLILVLWVGNLLYRLGVLAF